MPAEMTMLADHPARQLLDFSQKLDINLLDNVVNSMYHDIGSQVRTAISLCGLQPLVGANLRCLPFSSNVNLFCNKSEDFVACPDDSACETGIHQNGPAGDLQNIECLLCCCFVATSRPGGSDQPQGPPRCLDEGRHHPGVLSEHENQSTYLSHAARAVSGSCNNVRRCYLLCYSHVCFSPM